MGRYWREEKRYTQNLGVLLGILESWAKSNEAMLKYTKCKLYILQKSAQKEKPVFTLKISTNLLYLYVTKSGGITPTKFFVIRSFFHLYCKVNTTGVCSRYVGKYLSTPNIRGKGKRRKTS